MAVVSAPGASGGLWTHTPVDWGGNEGRAKPSGWPSDAVVGAPGWGTKPGGVMPGGITVLSATPGSGTVTITWTTSVPSSSIVNLGTTANYGTTVTDPALVTAHSVTIPNLAHAQLYHYTVASHGQGMSSIYPTDNTFTTT